MNYEWITESCNKTNVLHNRGIVRKRMLITDDDSSRREKRYQCKSRKPPAYEKEGREEDLGAFLIFSGYQPVRRRDRKYQPQLKPI